MLMTKEEFEIDDLCDAWVGIENKELLMEIEFTNRIR